MNFSFLNLKHYNNLIVLRLANVFTELHVRMLETRSTKRVREQPIS